MTTPTYSINGGSELPGIVVDWQRQAKRRNTDGSIDWQPYALHTWEAASITVANYLVLQALIGTILTSLATSDIDDRNEAATYTGAEMLSLAGEQVGQRMVNVRAEFRVDIS